LLIFEEIGFGGITAGRDQVSGQAENRQMCFGGKGLNDIRSERLGLFFSVLY